MMEIRITKIATDQIDRRRLATAGRFGAEG